MGKMSRDIKEVKRLEEIDPYYRERWEENQAMGIVVGACFVLMAILIIIAAITQKGG